MFETTKGASWRIHRVVFRRHVFCIAPILLLTLPFLVALGFSFPILPFSSHSACHMPLFLSSFVPSFLSPLLPTIVSSLLPFSSLFLPPFSAFSPPLLLFLSYRLQSFLLPPFFSGLP